MPATEPGDLSPGMKRSAGRYRTASSSGHGTLGALCRVLERLFPGRLRLDRLVGERRSDNSFDLLRLIAALMVLFGHSFDLMGQHEALFPLLPQLGWGAIGVLVFFATSGFLVTGSWDRDPHLLSFAARRVLRLWPALVVSLLVSALVLGPLLTSLPPGGYLTDPRTAHFVLDNSLMRSDYYLPGVFVHNVYPGAVNGSLWTLPVEVHAYLAVALLGLISAALGWRWTTSLAAALALLALLLDAAVPMRLLALGASVAGAQGLAYQWAILTGCFLIAAGLYQLRRWVPMSWWLCGLAAAACAAVALLDRSGAYRWWALLAPYIVLCVAHRVRRPGWMTRLGGDYSYGIYVYAFPVQQTISHLTGRISGWEVFGLALPPTLALAALSWRLVEAPALALKEGLGQRLVRAGAQSPT